MARPCRHTGCANLVASQAQKGYCDEHAQYRSNWTKHQRGLSSAKRGYGYQWRKLREQVLKRDKYLCQCEQCKAEGRIKQANDVDHIIPKAKGGTDSMDNLRAINAVCHQTKTATSDSK